MEITSNHLEVVPFEDYAQEGELIQHGDEKAKRSQTFGWPVGKSARTLMAQSMPG
jgi:DNA-directed RNA polymerase II subunit RPB3